MWNKKCNTCGYCDAARKACALYGRTIDVNADYCSKHIKLDNLEICAICGNPIVGGVYDIDSDTYLHLECAKQLGTCATCQLALVCEFNTNPDPTPKAITQTLRQGNMTIQQQVRNPDRIDMFCKECACFDTENGCLKQNNCCAQWKNKMG